MNFGAAAIEVANWAYDNVYGALLIAGAFTATAAITVMNLKERFSRPTPTGLDDPTIKATHARIGERLQRLGIRSSEP